MRFSVVIPTYNRGEALLPTLTAVRSQEHDSFEIIVVDDGSTDGTADRVRSIGDNRVAVVSRANGGISAARNTGAGIARGSFLVPLDDDDIPDPGWLQGFDDALRSTDPEAAVAFCGCRLVDSETGVLVEIREPQPLGPVFGNQTGLLLAGVFAVRRDVWADLGGFAEDLLSSHQTEFGLRLLPVADAHGWSIASVTAPLLTIREL